MTIRYSQIDRSKAAHAKPLAEGLVLGFAVFDYGNNMETVYYETAKGEYFTSGERKISSSFKEKYMPIASIPSDAEFIGHYYRP